MVKHYSQREKNKISCVQPFCFYHYNLDMGDVDLLDRFISQYRPTVQAKKWYWPLFVNCIEMLTVAAWRLHVTQETFPRLDFLEFIQSVVGGLMNTISFSSSDPNESRKIITSVGLHHPVNVETQGRCSNCKNNSVKNVKNVVFACILCASWITISNKIVSFSGIFVVVSCHLESFLIRKCFRKICSKMITSIIRYHTAIHYIMSITRDRFRPYWVSSGGCKKHSIINMLKKQIILKY